MLRKRWFIRCLLFRLSARPETIEKRAESVGKLVTWPLAMKRSKRKALPKNKLGRMLEKLEHLKSGVPAKVEHPRSMSSRKPVPSSEDALCGLAKNTAQLFTLFGLANLVLAGMRLTITETRSALYLARPIDRLSAAIGLKRNATT